MRAVVQRVARASVSVEGEKISSIGPGLLVLLAVQEGDGDGDREWMLNKIAQLRIFEDEEGKMNRSVLDCGGDVLVVSQFTLMGTVKKGTRPSFNRAAAPAFAEAEYERFRSELASILGRPVPGGRFAAMMSVELINDGPVTIILDSKQKDF